MDHWTPPTPDEIAEMRSADRAIEEARLADEERRRASRLGLHANVTAESETNFFTGFTMDISTAGVFIATYSPPQVGESVALRLTVAGEMELIVEGEVRWIRTDEDGAPLGCGVRFSGIDQRQRQALEAMMTRAEREPLLFEA